MSSYDHKQRHLDRLINRRTGLPHPMFDALNGYLPRSMQELFRWCEFLYLNNTNIYAGLQKQAEYILTEITFNTETAELRDKYKKLFRQNLKAKRFMQACQKDKMVYGNALFSMFAHRRRQFFCSRCGTLFPLDTALDIKYKYKARTFTFTCPTASCQARHSGIDLSQFTYASAIKPKDLRLVRWDVKQVEIEENPITGEEEYWLNIPTTIVDKIKEGRGLYVLNTPDEFLETVSDDKAKFKFDNNEIFHMKNPAPAGMDTPYGIPRILVALKKHFHAAILQRANQAIAFGHIVPLPVISPAQSNNANNPIQKMSGDQWRSKLASSIDQHRHDPLHVFFSGTPIQVTNLFGQGRALMVLGEIKQAENDIITSLGFPPEFVSGGLTFTGSSITLRMLENSLIGESADVVDALNWVADKAATLLKWDKVTCDLTPFKLVDDVQQKGMMLSAMSNGLLPPSQKTVAEFFSLDVDKMNDQRVQEAVDNARIDKDIERRIQEMSASLAAQATAATNSNGLNYDTQAMIAAATPYVEQAMQVSHEERRSMFAQMQNEDPIMYAVIKMLYEQRRDAPQQ